MDLNDDMKIDVLIPVKYANGTDKIFMFEWETNTTHDLTPNWKGYQLMDSSPRIHLGDFNQDGFVDVVALVQKDKSKKVWNCSPTL